MKTKLTPTGWLRGRKKTRPSLAAGRPGEAFSLIEFIAIMAVIVILAFVLVPSFIKRLDQAVRDKENADLQACVDALQRSIQRNRIIPGAVAGPTHWASVIATELGVNVSTVVTNVRRAPRVFLIDTNFQIGANGARPPYQQGLSGSVIMTNGFVIPPTSPRMMILSSIGPTNPPSVLCSGFPSDTDFNAIWNAADNTIPAGPAWAGWTGRGDDLVIKRVNLSPLFVHLMLFNYPSNATRAAYAIDRLGTNWVPNASVGTNIYIIKNTLLGLFQADGVTLDSEQIINQDSTFVFDRGAWRNSIFNGPGDAGPGAQSIADLFLSSMWNPNASVVNGSKARQSNVVVSAMGYMNAYDSWADSGFASGARKTAVLTAQGIMMQTVNGLINNPVQGNCQ